jgi:acetyl-CoA carboxylase biotin carboxyl carrier protein
VAQPDKTDERRSARSAADRTADHAAIDRLSGELLPALIAKLGATGLGELEVREGGWRVRLRRPLDGGVARRERRVGDRLGDRAHERGAERSGEHGAERAGRTMHHVLEAVTARTESRKVATSPAVGIFQPRAELTAGTRVQSGDRLGAVDMLGIPQEVLAPVDGVVGTSLVEPGEAVEYGQELLVIEYDPTVPGATNGTGA